MQGVKEVHVHEMQVYIFNKFFHLILLYDQIGYIVIKFLVIYG
jgi:hypothetical protein